MSIDPTLSPQYVLLGFLFIGPSHPYELYQEFSRELGRVWRIGQSQFYAYLKQAAGAGLACVSTEPQPNRPPRHIYQISPAGRDAFLEWVRRPTPHLRHLRLEFLARLYFYRRLKLSGLEQLIAAQKAVLQPRLAILHQSIENSDDRYWRLVLEFRLHETEAALRWLDRCLAIGLGGNQ